MTTAAASDRPTRVAADLLDSAAAEGARQSRSAKQQLDHWARVGRAVSMTQTAARRRVEAALAGTLPERELSAEERAVFNAEVDAAVSETARRVRFGEVLSGRGVTTVALDANGVLTRYQPDGSSSPLV
jgi:pimeloyl-ACP methyl ester carboxylesterase